MLPLGNDLYGRIWNFVRRPVNKVLCCCRIFESHKAKWSEICCLHKARLHESRDNLGKIMIKWYNSIVCMVITSCQNGQQQRSCLPWHPKIVKVPILLDVLFQHLRLHHISQRTFQGWSSGISCKRER